MTSSADVPPAEHEIEVSIFGPGIGECVVVHLGRGDWMIIDSCLEDGEPVALRYLRRLGVPISSVKHVLVSHWHDDHIRGASAILEAATAARFHCSGALKRDEFLRLIKANHLPHVSTGTSEMEALLRIVRCRLPAGARAASAGPSWVHERQLLYRGDRATVWALSPSAATTTLSQHELARLLPSSGPKRHVVAQKANALAVVLRVDVGSTAILLGSDLETSKNPLTGWVAVAAAARDVGSRKACVVKVAHHGSHNGDDASTWSELVEPDAHAAVTPFHPSGLPSAADCERIRTRTEHAYVTAAPKGRRAARRDMQPVINQTARSRRVIGGPMGHARFRMPAGGSDAADVAVELHGAASRLE